MFQDLSTELLRDGYSIRFRAGGMSMSPVIRDGEAVTIEPISAGEIRRGDILLYRSTRGLLAHRVVRLEPGSADTRRLTLRGDASASTDDPVTACAILGRVRAVERDGRTYRLSGRRARARWRLHQFAERLRDLVAIAAVITGKAERD